MKEAELVIERISKKGRGVVARGKRDIEVPFTLPGERVSVTLNRRRATLQQVLDPAVERVEPRCPHYSQCGGCALQHMSYEAQLAHKEEIVRKALGQSEPIIPCEEPWRYRNKMEFSFSEDLAGAQYLGLMMPNGRGRVCNLSECHLVSEWFVETLEKVRAWWAESDLHAYHPPSDRGSLRTLTLREGKRTGDHLVMVTVSGNTDYIVPQERLEAFVAVVGGERTCVALQVHQAEKGKPTRFFETILAGPPHMQERLEIPGLQPLSFSISPTAFFQPNTLQAERLYSLALKYAAIGSDDVVYDLYCGTGTLGIVAALKAKRVIGIELNSEAAADARENIAANGLKNVEIHAGDVGQVLKYTELPKPDIVLVDPPRVGLDKEALLHLLKLRAPKIVYVSCNPATQGENVSFLLDRGYRLTAVQPVDQFPHTPHVENVAVLEAC